VLWSEGPPPSAWLWDSHPAGDVEYHTSQWNAVGKVMDSVSHFFRLTGGEWPPDLGE